MGDLELSVPRATVAVMLGRSAWLVADLAGCEIVVVNRVSLYPERELAEDLLAIVHTFSCRLYGLRNYRKTLKRALAQDVSP